MRNPFRCFNSSPEVIRLTVMMYIRYPLSLRQVEDLLFERGLDICHETVRFWWNRFGPMFAKEIRNVVFRLDHIRTGVGTWTRSSSGSMERRIISGVRLITKAKCLRSS
jgi:transposase-like protein